MSDYFISFIVPVKKCGATTSKATAALLCKNDAKIVEKISVVFDTWWLLVTKNARGNSTKP